MTSKELAKIAVKALEDKKGEDITVIDISEISVLADYFIIAGGSNRSQIQAMADNVTDSIVVLGNHPTLNKVYIANIKTNEFNEFQVNAEKLISCLQIEGGV